MKSNNIMQKRYCYLDRAGIFRSNSIYIRDNPLESISFGFVEGATLYEIELKCKEILRKRINKIKEEQKDEPNKES